MNAPGRLILIAGPCVIESEKLCLQVASALKKTCDRLGVFYVFKASYDKANRTSAKSFRGPGLEEGLAVLAKVRARVGVPSSPMSTRKPRPRPRRRWRTFCKSRPSSAAKPT